MDARRLAVEQLSHDARDDPVSHRWGSAAAGRHYLSAAWLVATAGAHGARCDPAAVGVSDSGVVFLTTFSSLFLFLFGSLALCSFGFFKTGTVALLLSSD